MADIDFGQLSEALNDKMDRGGMNAQSPCAVVVSKQDPTADNNYTWYRKYSDGWVEQGGLYNNGANRPTISLPVPINYTFQAQATILWNSTSSVANTIRVVNSDGTTITFHQANGTSVATFAFAWEVKGIAVN